MGEAETEPLRLAIGRCDTVATSRIARVEVGRAARRRSAETARVALEVLEGFVVLPLDDAVLAAAQELEPSALRSLDALHVASAMSLGDELESIITYDHRMREAAALARLRVRAPS